MPDRWTLVTPQGDYLLNASFFAPRLHPGGVDTSAALRRDGLRSYQRTGDGLRTPGPLILNGRVWRDDHEIQAIVDELNEIQDAVKAATQVRRENDAGSYIYRDLAGGPVPVMTPDGLGGWRVEIELWPGNPKPTFIPVRFDTRLYIYIDGTGSMDADRTNIESALADLKSLLADELYGDQVDNRVFIETTPDSTNADLGADGERWLAAAATPTEDDAVIVAIFNETEPRYHSVPRNPSLEPTSFFLTDYDAWRTRFASTSYRRMILYAIEQSGEWADLYAAFRAHVPPAINGTGGYPDSPSLAELGVSYRLDVPSGQSAQAYFDDIWSLLLPGG